MNNYKLNIPIGIDLGTSTSEISAFIDGACRTLVDTSSGTDNPIIPSVIAYDADNDEIYVGQDAEKYPNCIREAKREMGTDKKLPENANDGDKTFLPEDVSAFILTYLKRIAEQNLSVKDIQDVVITIPAIFDENARLATLKAAKMANLNVLQLVDEPVAAATYYSDLNREKWVKDRPIQYLVFDFGGGTLDLSLCSKVANTISVTSTTGDPKLGGKDVDEMFMAYVQNRYIKENPTAKIVLSRLKMKELKDQCKMCKQKLSLNPSSRIKIDSFANIGGKPVNLNMRITCEDFEKHVMQRSPIPQRESILDRIKEKLDYLFNVLLKGVPKKNIDYLLFVGGSSYIPCVQKMVKDYLEISDENAFCYEPNLAVSRGAALYAANESISTIINAPDLTPEEKNKNLTLFKTTFSIKEENILTIRPRTPYGLGCKVIVDEKDVYWQWIPPQNELPFNAVFGAVDEHLDVSNSLDHVQLHDPNQTNAIFPIWQSPFNDRVLDIETKGLVFTGKEGRINNIPPTNDGTCRKVEVHVNMDKSGLLEVTFYIPSTQQREVIKYKSEVVVSESSKKMIKEYAEKWE